MIAVTHQDKYEMMMNDRFTPEWVKTFLRDNIHLDVCDLLSGIEGIKEIVEIKFEELCHDLRSIGA